MEESRRYASEVKEDGLVFQVSGNLPTEIIISILARLPLKSLSKFRWACKSWFNLITHTRFAHFHYTNSLQNKTSPCVLLCNKDKHDLVTIFALVDHQSFDEHQISINAVNIKKLHPKFRIVGSSNGLICFCEVHPTLFYLWNPIIQEHVALPKLPVYIAPVASGFGFDSCSNHYKAIQFFQFDYDPVSISYRCEAAVCTIGSGSWRKIKNAPYISAHGKAGFGTFANGSLHWLTYPCTLHPVMEVGMEVVIVSFNLETEEFGVIKTHLALDSFNPCNQYLDVFDNQLCIVNRASPFELEIWVMVHYGVNESWSLKLVFGGSEMYYTGIGHYKMMTVKTGELLRCGEKLIPRSRFLLHYGTTRYLSYYEPQTKMNQLINIESDLIYWDPFVFHGSLHSPMKIEGSTERLRLV